MSTNLFIVFLIATFSIGTYAQSSCTTALVSLSPCLNYITGNDTAPSDSCCSKLASVVKSDPQCLCTVLNGGSSGSLGLTVNETKALALPGDCKVQTPPVSKCNSNGSPSSANAPSSTTPSSTTSTGSGNGSSKGVPDTTSINSAAIYQKTSFHFFFALLVASVIMIA